MQARRWTTLPPIGTPLDRSYPLCQGLVYFAPIWEAGGPIVGDAASGNAASLALAGGATWAMGSSPGLSCTSGTARAQANTPVPLQLNVPCAIALGFRSLGAPTGNASLLGTTYASTSTSPYYGITIGISAAQVPLLFYGFGTGTSGVSANLTASTGRDYVVSGNVG